MRDDGLLSGWLRVFDEEHEEAPKPVRFHVGPLHLVGTAITLGVTMFDCAAPECEQGHTQANVAKIMMKSVRARPLEIEKAPHLRGASQRVWRVLGKRTFKSYASRLPITVAQPTEA